MFSDTRGSLAITAAVGGVVMVGVVGAAFDASRLVGSHHTLQALADTAAVAAMTPEGLSSKERDRIARSVVRETASQNNYDIDVDRTAVKVGEGPTGDQRVTVSLTSDVDLVFGGAVGLNSYSIGASATATETFESGDALGALTAISYVVDLSSSMDGDLESLPKLQMVKAAIQQATTGPHAPEAAGLYPFNWGTVDDKVVPLQPGSAAVANAITTAQTNSGSVPSDAFERVVQDIAARNGEDEKNIVVYITDGGIQTEKADTRGQYVSDADYFPAGVPGGCRNIADRAETAQNELAQYMLKVVNDYGIALDTWDDPQAFDDDLVKFDSNDSIAETIAKQRFLVEASTEVLVRNGGVAPEALERNWTMPGLNTGVVNAANPMIPGGEINGLIEQLNYVAGERRNLRKELEKWDRKCVPEQKRRVMDACTVIRENASSSVVAVDLSVETGAAADVTRQCAFGEIPTKRGRGGETNVDFPFPGLTAVGGTGSGDPLRYTDENGSVYVQIENLRDLGGLLESLTEELNSTAKAPERTVQLSR